VVAQLQGLRAKVAQLQGLRAEGGGDAAAPTPAPLEGADACCRLLSRCLGWAMLPW
jgi:hypothetical protein